MKRGLLQGIIPEEFINASPRNWNILLLKSLDIWGELAYSDSLLSNYKSSVKKHIINYIFPNDDFDRYPIYFISIRPKTRFNKYVKFQSTDRKYFTLTFFEGLIPGFKKFNVEEVANFLDIDCKNGVTIYVEPKYLVCSNDQFMICFIDSVTLLNLRIKYCMWDILKIPQNDHLKVHMRG